MSSFNTYLKNDVIQQFDEGLPVNDDDRRWTDSDQNTYYLNASLKAVKVQVSTGVITESPTLPIVTPTQYGMAINKNEDILYVTYRGAFSEVISQIKISDMSIIQNGLISVDGPARQIVLTSDSRIFLLTGDNETVTNMYTFDPDGSNQQSEFLSGTDPLDQTVTFALSPENQAFLIERCCSGVPTMLNIYLDENNVIQRGSENFTLPSFTDPTGPRGMSGFVLDGFGYFLIAGKTGLDAHLIKFKTTEWDDDTNWAKISLVNREGIGGWCQLYTDGANIGIYQNIGTTQKSFKVDPDTLLFTELSNGVAPKILTYTCNPSAGLLRGNMATGHSNI